jgi:hypothetical protein
MVEELQSLLSNEENKEIINEIASNEEYKDEFKLILKESIRKYYNIVLKNNNVSLET